MLLLSNRQCLKNLGAFILFSTWCVENLADAATASDPAQRPCVTASAKPIQIPIHNVTLGDGTVARGLAVSLGTPPQALALQVESSNNTYLYDDSATCDKNMTEPECTARFGGLFDESKSSSWHQYQGLTAPGFGPLNNTIEQGASKASYTGTDDFKFNDAFTLHDFAFGLDKGGSLSSGASLGTLGLGPNSTLLTTLEADGTIQSKTWSMFQGWSGAEASQQIDGTVIFGGYDKAKVTGPNVTLPLNVGPSCPSGFQMTIESIDMNLKNGSSSSLLGSSRASALQACMDPKGNALSLPYDMWSNFLKISGSTEVGRSSSAINFYNMLILADGAYDGDLTISVYPDLEIRIPNHQLVIPQYDINSKGQTIISNASTREVQIYSLQGNMDNDLPQFGKPFLSSTYILADNDNQEFTLWKSQPSSEQEIVAIGPPICSSISSSSTVAAIPSSTNTDPPPLHTPSVSKGAIAGGVVGGLVAIAFCTGALFLLAKRRRAKRGQHAEAIDAEDRSLSQLFDKPEMASDQHPPLEMSDTRDPGYTMAPYEMPGSKNAQYTMSQYELPPDQSSQCEISRYEMPSGKDQASAVPAYEMPATPMVGRPF